MAVRAMLRLSPGDSVDFGVDQNDNIIIRKSAAKPGETPDRFDAARGRAEIKWGTEELMAILRKAD